MFATFRSTWDQDGEVVCVSSTNRLPQPGQNQNHTACDNCRAKKLKCTGQRFGCQRCRDRNLVCTYPDNSQSKRRRTSRAHAPAKSGSRSEQNLIPASEESSILVSTSTLPVSRVGGTRFNSQPERLDPVQTDENRSSTYQSSQESEQNPTPQSESQSLVEADFSTLTAQSSHSSIFPGLNMKMLDQNFLLSDVSQENDTLGSNFDFAIFEEDKDALHSASPMEISDNAFFGKFEHSLDLFILKLTKAQGIIKDDDTAKSNSRRPSEPSRQYFNPVKMISPSISSPKSYTTFSNETGNISHVNSPSPVPVKAASRIRSSTMSTPNLNPQQHSQCRCMEITLAILEKLQKNADITESCAAEQSLDLVKRGIRQFKSLAHCQICRGSSGLMTLSILLIERMVSTFEDIAVIWDTGMQALASPQNSPSMGCESESGVCFRNNFGIEGGGRCEVLFGEYQIDTMEEWCELFRIMILLQIKQLFALLEMLRSQVASSNCNSYLGSLRNANRRIRQLEETLGRMM